MELRLAQQHEAGICYQCIEDARAYHKSLGFEQWHPDYPTQQTIFDDISRGIGYAFTDDVGTLRGFIFFIALLAMVIVLLMRSDLFYQNPVLAALKYNEDERFDASKWRGQNILGFALMEVRSILRKAEEYDNRYII